MFHAPSVYSGRLWPQCLPPVHALHYYLTCFSYGLSYARLTTPTDFVVLFPSSQSISSTIMAILVVMLVQNLIFFVVASSLILPMPSLQICKGEGSRSFATLTTFNMEIRTCLCGTILFLLWSMSSSMYQPTSQKRKVSSFFPRSVMFGALVVNNFHHHLHQAFVRLSSSLQGV